MKPLKFVILSDLHLGAAEGAPVNGLDTGARLMVPSDCPVRAGDTSAVT